MFIGCVKKYLVPIGQKNSLKLARFFQTKLLRTEFSLISPTQQFRFILGLEFQWFKWVSFGVKVAAAIECPINQSD